MRRSISTFAIVVISLTAGCGVPSNSGEPTEAGAERQILAEGIFMDRDGAELGTVHFIQDKGAAIIDFSIAGLRSGEHAIHLHTTGLCEAPEFVSAGGHLNPSGATHGSLSEGGKHLGDLLNIELPGTGSLAQQIVIDGDPASIQSAIFDEDRTSVVIHADRDDYMTDPAGNAGPRIACAVLNPTS